MARRRQLTKPVREPSKEPSGGTNRNTAKQLRQLEEQQFGTGGPFLDEIESSTTLEPTDRRRRR